MGKIVATPKNTFQTPKRNTGNDDDDVVTAQELVDMEARLAKRLDDEKTARDDEKATRDAQMSQLMAAIAALQPQTPPLPQPQPLPQPPPQPAGVRRPINTSSLERLEHDVGLRDFLSWKTQWNDFCRIQHLAQHPVEEQISALRMTFSKRMLQLVEMTLGYTETSLAPPNDILDSIQQYIRKREASRWIESSTPNAASNRMKSSKTFITD